jgi:hypothetical protein
MKIIPTETFTGYPDWRKTRFVAGVETTVPKAYGEMLKRKGLAAPPKKTAEVSDPPGGPDAFASNPDN